MLHKHPQISLSFCFFSFPLNASLHSATTPQPPPPSISEHYMYHVALLYKIVISFQLWSNYGLAALEALSFFYFLTDPSSNVVFLGNQTQRRLGSFLTLVQFTIRNICLMGNKSKKSFQFGKPLKTHNSGAYDYCK